jgi:hypothetical protein
MINVGGARPGETSMSTFGHPGRYTCCIGENEEAPMAAIPRGPRIAGRRVRRHLVRRRRATRNLGSFEPNRPRARRISGRVDGRFGKSETRREPDAMISNFPSTEEIHVVAAGGIAGRFRWRFPVGSARRTVRVRLRVRCK